MYYWSKGKQSTKCEFCLTVDEYTIHICRHRNSDRSLMFKVSVNELTTWLRSTLGEQCIAATVKQYLLYRGEAILIDCVHGNYTELAAVATASDCLGWDSMLEGRISTRWLILVAPFLLKTGWYLLPQVWGTQFITRLINIVHNQWIYRNSVIHYHGKDSLTIPEHHDIINRVESHFLTDPNLLLPRHRFLMDADFEVLGSRPASDHLIWLANMDSAVAVSTLSHAGTVTPAAEEHFAQVGMGRSTPTTATDA